MVSKPRFESIIVSYNFAGSATSELHGPGQCSQSLWVFISPPKTGVTITQDVPHGAITSSRTKKSRQVYILSQERMQGPKRLMILPRVEGRSPNILSSPLCLIASTILTHAPKGHIIFGPL